MSKSSYMYLVELIDPLTAVFAVANTQRTVMMSDLQNMVVEKRLYFLIAYSVRVAPVGKSYSSLDFEADVVVSINAGFNIDETFYDLEVMIVTWEISRRLFV
uniref:Uncharacterized protein n=1 Tax=Bactrocera dorsalis TaxID=27457 RepID=A0A034V277_BACDO